MKHSTPRLLMSLLMAVSLLLLAACDTAGDAPGEGNDMNDDTAGGGGDVSRIGYLTASDETGSIVSEPSVSATFFTAEGDFVSDAYFDDPYARSLDTCTVVGGDDTPTDVPTPDVDLALVGAGEAVTFTAEGSAEAYATLERREMAIGEDTLIAYVLPDDVTLESPMPTNLNVSIPGSSSFPAFDTVAMPEVPAGFTLDEPADGTVTADTVFEWDASSTPEHSAVQFDLRVGATMISCTAEDDGTFELPAETVSELGADFTASLDAATRETMRVERDGDAALLLTSEFTHALAF